MNTQQLVQSIPVEAAAAIASQNLSQARHHAMRAQNAFNTLTERLTAEGLLEHEEAKLIQLSITLEDAWSAVCAIQAAERQAHQQGTTQQKWAVYVPPDQAAYQRSQIPKMGIEQAAGARKEDIDPDEQDSGYGWRTAGLGRVGYETMSPNDEQRDTAEEKEQEMSRDDIGAHFEQWAGSPVTLVENETLEAYMETWPDAATRRFIVAECLRRAKEEKAKSSGFADAFACWGRLLQDATTGAPLTPECITEYIVYGDGAQSVRETIVATWKKQNNYCQIGWVDPNLPDAQRKPEFPYNSTYDLNPAVGTVRCRFYKHPGEEEPTGFSEPLLICADHAKRMREVPNWEWVSVVPEPKGELAVLDHDEQDEICQD